MRPKTETITPAAADPNGISTAQTASGAGNLTITGALAAGGVATLDIPRRVAVTATGNNASVNFTITGTARTGQSLSETIAGPNATTVYTNNDFKTVTQVATSTGLSGNVEVGTNGVFSSRWIPLSHRTNPFAVSFVVARDGSSPSFTYTVQHTLSDIQASDSYDVNNLEVLPHEYIASATDNQSDGNYEFPVSAIRVEVTGYTAGTLKFQVAQAGR